MKISRSPSNSKLRNKEIMMEAPMPFVLSLNKTKTKRANAVKLKVRSSPLTNSTNAAGEGVNKIVGIPIPTAYAAQSAVESPEYSANNTVFLFTGCERSNSINSDELKKYIKQYKGVSSSQNNNTTWKYTPSVVSGDPWIKEIYQELILTHRSHQMFTSIYLDKVLLLVKESMMWMHLTRH